MKKKFGFIGIALVLALVASLSFGSVVLADDPPEGVIEINMTGNDYEFVVNTRLADAFDSFGGEAQSSLDMHQTVRYVESKKWASDAPDIDRWAQFIGEGSLQTESWYDSTKKWWDGVSYTKYYVESDTAGSLGQNLHLDGYFGGVKDVDQWKKQRDAQIYAEGDYYMSLTSVDQRGVDPDYGFSFEATDSSSWGNLFLETMATVAGHNGPDKLIVDFVYGYGGSPGVNVNWLAETGGNINMSIDLIEQFVSGSGTIW